MVIRNFQTTYLLDMIVDKLMSIAGNWLDILHSIPVQVACVIVAIYTRPK